MIFPGVLFVRAFFSGRPVKLKVCIIVCMIEQKMDKTERKKERKTLFILFFTMNTHLQVTIIECLLSSVIYINSRSTMINTCIVCI